MTRPHKPAQAIDAIPVGYYHQVMTSGTPIRRAWHVLKFTRVIECLPQGPRQSILDIGCFAGSFLSLLREDRFDRQVGVDILPEQIRYATGHFGTPFRRFVCLENIDGLVKLEGGFDCVTLIEVIEHLRPQEIGRLMGHVADKLKPGGRLVLSTPNYASTWPLLEILLNRFSDVTYDEQHITRFSYFNCVTKLHGFSPSLGDDFRLLFKTTTHLLSPFLAIFGVESARRASSLVPHRTWKMPFGNLLLLAFERS
jgi:2-polyprenyl-3-methyl-5-hydroxy-6-metoxy-1,4-benzoquinol methylase